MDSKLWYQSKTLWINGIGTIITLVSAMTGLIPTEYLQFVLAFIGIANIVLRLLKNEQILPITGMEGTK